MEDVLEVYTRPYDPRRPLVCMDETSKQLLRDTPPALPPAPGRPACRDYEDEREGVLNLVRCCEPRAGQRWVAVTAQRTRRDWAQQIRHWVAVRSPDAERVVLVLSWTTATCTPRRPRRCVGARPGQAPHRQAGVA